jgi:hypothetical protein
MVKMGDHSGLLRTIPLLDAQSGNPLDLIEQTPERFDALLKIGHEKYGDLFLKTGDALALRWLKKANNPYHKEIEHVVARAGRPGAAMLNLSYEFACSTSVGPDPFRRGNRLLRTLDWPLQGLGANVVVAHCNGQAGPYYAITWPGSAGVLTGMAPQRFSAAINQPPLSKILGHCWMDWVLGRPSVWRTNALPAAHLLRRVFDECSSFEDAKTYLVTTPIATPAFFSLSGAKAEEGCIIERTEAGHALHETPTCITNHWLKTKKRGHILSDDSKPRLEALRNIFEETENDFHWVKPPILNRKTRLSVVANAQEAELMVQGWENETPATTPFNLQDVIDGETTKTRSGQALANQA